MKKGSKTNAIRCLEKRNVLHQVVEYDMDDEGDLSAQHVSQVSGIPVDMLYKTIVCRGDKTGVILACVPGNLEVDMKKLAKASGNKKVESVPLKEILPLTGYIRGGVSPIGCKKDYPLYVSDTIRSKVNLYLGGAQGVSDSHRPR